MGNTAPAFLHGGALVATDAKTVGKISGGLTDGYACVTERSLGKGKVVMLSVMPLLNKQEGKELITQLLNHYALDAKVTDTYNASAGTVMIYRCGDDEYKSVITVINATDNEGWYELKTPARSLFSNIIYPEGIHKIPSFGYDVFVAL